MKLSDDSSLTKWNPEETQRRVIIHQLETERLLEDMQQLDIFESARLARQFKCSIWEWSFSDFIMVQSENENKLTK